MPNPNQFLGRATVRWNGNVIETNSGASLDIGGVGRDTIITGTRVGFAEKTMPAILSCETSLEPDMSLDELRNIDDATVQFECDTGQTYVIRNAFLTDTPVVKDGAGGNVTLNFSGPPAEEIE
ncbi:MAG: phage tail protein [Rhodospirillaceae bacterium]|nr:MAG: phage tail protein [Rhodospirillaceae bacterium]